MPWDTPSQTYLSGNVAGTTHHFGPGVTLQGGSNITISGSAHDNLVFVGGAGAAGLGGVAAGASTQTAGTVWFNNLNGLSFGYQTGANSTNITASYTVPNVPAQTQFVLSNSNGLGWGTNGSTVTGSYTVPTQSTQPALNAVSDSARSVSGVTLNFSNSNGVGWGLGSGANSSVLTASYTQFSLANSNGVSFGTNGANGAVTGSVQTNYAGTGTAATNASVTLNTAGISISVAAPGGGAAATASYWDNPAIHGMSYWVASSNVISVQRAFIPMNITATMAEFVMSLSGSSSGAASIRFNLGIYTMNHSTLSTVSTASRGLTFQSTSAISYTAVSGVRSWSIPLGAGWNIAPGEYFIAFNYGMTTASSNTVSLQLLGGGIANGAQLPPIAGWDTGALGNNTSVFRSSGVNNVSASTLADTMQLSGMTFTGIATSLGVGPPLQPWVGFYGSF